MPPRIVRMPGLQRLLWLPLLLAGSADARPALAQSDADPLRSSFAIDDQDPEHSVPDAQQALKQPLEMGYHLMLLTEKAEAAAKAGDHRLAAKYWAAVAKAVPDRSLPYAKMCQEYDAALDYENALENCRSALGRGGVTLEDNLRLVRIVTEKRSGPLDATEIADVQAVSDHVEKQLGEGQGPLIANRIRCQLATRLDDVNQLISCSKKLEKVAPNDVQTLVFSWSLAMRQGHLARAQEIVDRATRAGLPAAAIEKMSSTLRLETERRWPWWRRALRSAQAHVVVVTLLALALATGAAAAVLGRRRRQRLGMMHHVHGRAGETNT